MRVVANGAIFLRGRMVINEWPALLHVAGETGVIDIVSHHVAGSGRTVRVVAIRTDHLAFTDGMTGRAVNQCAQVFVAVKTHFRLGDAVAYFVLLGMYLVAGRASRVAIGVQAAGPVHALATLVAC